MATACRVAATSWTRTTAAPAAAASVTAASEAARRSAGSFSPAAERNRFREAPTRTGDAEPREATEAREQREVVLGALAEADPGIDPDATRIDTGGDCGSDPRRQERVNLREHVLVMRGGLHRRGRPLHVHEHDRRASRGDEGQHGVVGAAGTDVVHHVGAGGERGFGDRGLRRIDRDRMVLSCRIAATTGTTPSTLFVGGDRLRPGSGGFAADVDQVGTRGDEDARASAASTPAWRPPS